MILGLCLIESRSPVEETTFYDVTSVKQTLSLGVSLIESAGLLDEVVPDLAKIMRERGRTYVNGFLNAPHDIENGIFVNSCLRSTGEIKKKMVTWGSKYGGASSFANTGLIALFAYRLTQDDRLLAWTLAAAQPFLSEPITDDEAVPAKDPAAAIGLLADLYDITGEDAWLDGGLKLADHVMGIYLDRDLPRGSSQTEVYESQLGAGDLLYALVRLALLADKATERVLPPDYSRR